MTPTDVSGGSATGHRTVEIEPALGVQSAPTTAAQTEQAGVGGGVLRNVHLSFRVGYLWSEGCDCLERINEDEGAARSVKSLPLAHIIIDERLGEGAVGIAWAGNMYFKGSEESPIRVAVKIAEGEKGAALLRDEDEVYKHLTKAGLGLGYYGTFGGEFAVTMLVMDYLGKSLKSFEDGDFSRKKLFEGAIALHKAGVSHNDLEPRNVVVDEEGDVHIIDFHLAGVGHDCPGPLECDELCELGDILGIDQDAQAVLHLSLFGPSYEERTSQ